MSDDWRNALLDELAAERSWSYRPTHPASSEPAALTALALLAHDRDQQALPALEWLAATQNEHGAVPVRRDQGAPLWTTSLALLAWRLVLQRSSHLQPDAARHAQRAQAALLSLRGKPGQHSQELVGHNASLVAWAWVQETHSWVEPTALAVLALKAGGLHAHPRTREAVRLLLDRQLASGGCNYGNTIVLGQMLRPHIMPSGMSLAALIGERQDARSQRSLKWLQHAWSQSTTAPSLAWALIGLAAHDALPADFATALQTCYQQRSAAQRTAYCNALLALAALGTANPLIELPLRAQGLSHA